MRGFFLSTGASCLTTGLLQLCGCSPERARVAGTAAATLVSAGKNLTPTGLAATAVSYGAGRLGLWAERRLMHWVYPEAPRQQVQKSKFA